MSRGLRFFTGRSVQLIELMLNVSLFAVRVVLYSTLFCMLQQIKVGLHTFHTTPDVTPVKSLCHCH